MGWGTPPRGGPPTEGTQGGPPAPRPPVGGSIPQAPGRYHVIPILHVVDCTQPAEAWLLHKVMRHMLREQQKAATAAIASYTHLANAWQARNIVQTFPSVPRGTSTRSKSKGKSKDGRSGNGEPTSGKVYKAALQAAGLTPILQPTFDLPLADWEPDVCVEYTRGCPARSLILSACVDVAG